MNRGHYATLAQLVEHLTRNEKVAGSIPAGGSTLIQTISYLLITSHYTTVY